MGDQERKVHVGNYVMPKELLEEYLKANIGPCRAQDPCQPRVEGKNPFGFVLFDKPEHAQACIELRRGTIDGNNVVFSSAKTRNDGQRNPVNTSGSGNSFSFAGVGDSSGNRVKRDSAPMASVSPLLPEKVQGFKAILSHSDGLDALYVQNVSGNRAVEYLQLQEQLSEHCCSKAKVISKPQPHQVYAALFSEDDNWYRCVVREVNTDGSYIVQFIDYGNQSKVQKEHLKTLTPAMAKVPPAAAKCHIRDFVAKTEFTNEVNKLLSTWHEVLLECELAPDHSVNLKNRETGHTLRSQLEGSGYVVTPLLNTYSGNTSGAETKSASITSTPKSKKVKSRLSSTSEDTQAAGDSSSQTQQKQVAELEKTVNRLTSENLATKKQLNVAKKENAQLSERKSIDVLNKELFDKLASVKALRSKFSASGNGVLNQAIEMLSNAAYTQDVHDEIFTPVLSLYCEYNKQQDQLRNLKESVDTVDPEQITRRNQTRNLFCEAVETCQQRCEELDINNRREKLQEILVKLSQLYPDISSSAKFDGDLELTISKFNLWQAKECDHIKEVQRVTEESLDTLKQQLSSIQKGLDLDSDVEEDQEHKLEETTKLVIAALSDELETTDLKEGKASTAIINSLCTALHTKIGMEFSLLDDMNTQLNKLLAVAANVTPHLGSSQPDKLEWFQKKEKKLKELKSKLRHRIADLDDLKENDDDDETELKEMEEEVENVRQQIHTVLLEMEEYLETLAQLTVDVFPEFAIQYPKFQLQAIQTGEGYMKPLRDISFYKGTGSPETAFNCEPVVIKTLAKPANYTTGLPDVVEKLVNSPVFNRHVKVEAVFSSKNGMNMYIQLSSAYKEVVEYLVNSPTLDLDALQQLVETTPVKSTSSVDSHATDGDQADLDDGDSSSNDGDFSL